MKITKIQNFIENLEYPSNSTLSDELKGSPLRGSLILFLGLLFENRFC
jgi:hypothetical protein